LKTVGRAKYIVRNHDSVSVQQHGDIAIVRGSMYIERQDKTRLAKYALKYVRVFVFRKGRWQLVSHTTVQEVHL
jgi:ketosteroid isomerase-like protein